MSACSHNRSLSIKRSFPSIAVSALTDASPDLQTKRLETKSEYRILDLVPGENEDDIECDIRTVALDSGEQYEALSYVSYGETLPARK